MKPLFSIPRDTEHKQVTLDLETAWQRIKKNIAPLHLKEEVQLVEIIILASLDVLRGDKD